MHSLPEKMVFNHSVTTEFFHSLCGQTSLKIWTSLFLLCSDVSSHCYSYALNPLLPWPQITVLYQQLRRLVSKEIQKKLSWIAALFSGHVRHYHARNAFSPYIIWRYKCSVYKANAMSSHPSEHFRDKSSTCSNTKSLEDIDDAELILCLLFLSKLCANFHISLPYSLKLPFHKLYLQALLLLSNKFAL